MNKTISIIAIIISFVALGIAIKKSNILGGATSGLYTTAGTSSTITIGTSSPTTLFAARNNCLFRSITTNSQRIKIYFSDLVSTSTLLSDVTVRGNHQSASTTEHYDSELFGCGIVTAIGFGGSNDFPGSTSSSTLTIEEYR